MTLLKAMAAICLLGVLGACVPTAGPPGSCPVRTDAAHAVFRPGTATVAVAGDVLLHAAIQREAAARPDHFGPAFSLIAPYLAMADVTIVNLEGPAAVNVLPGGRDAGQGPASRFDNRVYAGYPAFNYHPTITTTLSALGIDLVQTANNHALDRGPLGVDRTLQALAEAGLSVTGTVPRGAPAEWHHTMRLPLPGGPARVAFLACTYSVNGLPDPNRQALRCYSGSPSIPERIAALRARPDIDAVILLPHWGQEYTPSPDANQRRLARAAIEAGAAAVIGAHPHVLQPIEEVTASDGRRGFVAYSLGNFISSQWSLPRRTGAILYFDITRDREGRVVAQPPMALPTRVNRYVGQGIVVAPAATVPEGAQSVAHAQRILGPGRLVSPEDLRGC